MIQLEGTVASKGFAQGPAFLLPTREPPFQIDLGHHDPFAEGYTDVANEQERLATAKEQVVAHLGQVQASAARILSPQEAQIFEAHRMLLFDVGFYARIEKEIERGPHTAEQALKRALRIYEGFVNSTAHEQFQLKLHDLQDVWGQVMSCLRTGGVLPTPQPTSEVILVASTFHPSQLAQIPLVYVKGLITQDGSPNTTTASLARALNIPYFCGVEDIDKIEEGTELVLDGMASMLLLSPQKQIVKAYSNLADQWENRSARKMMVMRSLPSETRCHRNIALRADIQRAADLDEALQAGASGIGDVCTTSLFLERGAIPSESEQIELYEHYIHQIMPSRVAFRTLDLSTGQQFPEIPMPEERNPLFGWRGIRVTLAHRGLFLRQLTALLEASEAGSIRIVLPTVSTYEEIQDVGTLLDEAFQIVQARHPGRMTQYELGISVETVAAALQLDLFASKLDFVSVNTDALLQTVMAAERGNPRLLHLLSPLQPGFLRFLYQLCGSARQTRLAMIARGSMASEPLCVPFLLGLGFRELSVSPHMLPNIKKRIRRVSLDEAVQVTQDALRTASLQEVISLAHSYLDALPPEDTEGDETHIRAAITAREQVQKAISASITDMGNMDNTGDTGDTSELSDTGDTSGQKPRRTDDITAKEQ